MIEFETGAQLDAFRKEARASKKEFAVYLGIARATLDRWIALKKIPNKIKTRIFAAISWREFKIDERKQLK